VHWRSTTRDNITTIYGKDVSSRIFDPATPAPARSKRIFSWLICTSYDDKYRAAFEVRTYRRCRRALFSIALRS
jgi:hypothetical protein